MALVVNLRISAMPVSAIDQNACHPAMQGVSSKRSLYQEGVDFGWGRGLAERALALERLNGRQTA